MKTVEEENLVLWTGPYYEKSQKSKQLLFISLSINHEETFGFSHI